jgi:protein-tyrosine phosphatase
MTAVLARCHRMTGGGRHDRSGAGSTTRRAGLARDPPAIVKSVVTLKSAVTPPVGHPLQLLHPVLPSKARLWGAGRPSYPDEPPTAEAVETGVLAWRDSGVDLVLSLIEDWEVPRRAPGLFEALARQRIEVRRFPIADFGVPREAPEFGRLLRVVVDRLATGDGILVHCNAGLGRTALVLASVLKAHGLALDPVTELRRIYRATAMQEPLQETFVRELSTG